MTGPSSQPTEPIRVQNHERCGICDSKGIVLYRDQEDRLFGAGGSWTLKRCPTPSCGLVWLDPTPLREDIVKAYAHYYTHTFRAPADAEGWVRRAYDLVRRSYLSNRYRYPGDRTVATTSLLSGLVRLLPSRRHKIDLSVRFLSFVPGGRLLDVGCGAGEWLESMSLLGWKAIGVDFDERAVASGRSRGIDVRLGAIQDQRFEAEQFDAVTLHHVIEHVPDPIETLRECKRVLKRDGKLILLTPNSASLGHRVFRSDWRGLEPPRHLNLFSPSSMHAVLERAGFTERRVSTANSAYVWQRSARLRAADGRVSEAWVGLLWRACHLLEHGMLPVVPTLGENLVVVAGQLA